MTKYRPFLAVYFWKGVIWQCLCFSLWLPRGRPDRGGEEESGWIQTVAKDGDAWGRQKGRAALWWRYQTTQTEPEDFSFIFRALVHLVWPLVLLCIHIFMKCVFPNTTHIFTSWKYFVFVGFRTLCRRKPVKSGVSWRKCKLQAGCIRRIFFLKGNSANRSAIVPAGWTL